MNKSILFVDDDLDLLNTIEQTWTLLYPNWDIYIASNGVEGLSILGQNKVDILVSDIQMPGLDGATFLSEAKKQNRKLVCIALSGSEAPAPTEDVDLAQVVETYVMKPFSIELLHRDILKILKKIA